MKPTEPLAFDGFEPANTTPVPDVLFDVLLPHMNEAQLKVMLYIIRRTLGFKKAEDAISLKQFRYGIVAKDKITGEKKQLDEGCGLKNFTTISKALKDLEQMKCVERAPSKTEAGDDATTVYRIHFRGTAANVVPTTANVVGVLRQTDNRTTQAVVGVLRQTYPQETVIQDTDSQETVTQEEYVGAHAQHAHAELALTAEDMVELIEDVKDDLKRITDKHEAVRATNGKRNTPSELVAVAASLPPSAVGSPNSTTTQRAAGVQQVALLEGQAETVPRSRKRKDEPEPKCDPAEVQRRINAHRGYGLEEKVEIIRERQAIKTWCSLHELGDYDKVMMQLKRDPYWGKDENYYRIGGLTLLKETPKVLAAASRQQTEPPQPERRNYTGIAKQMREKMLAAQQKG